MSAYNPIATMQGLETGGFERKQAQTLIGALDDVRADLVTKPELEAGISDARNDFKAEMKLLRADFRADMANLSAAFDAKLNVMAWRICGSLGTLIVLGFGTLGFLITLHQTGGAR